MPAKVYLIGAGPGDPGLITVKGVSCIQEADVVIYDYLANSTLLSYARPNAKMIFVGKKGFSEHVTQEQINDCIIEEAQGNRVIARLKGGDPFVFGRGGEEALALKAAGISYEVIPGVTSGIAAPAYAGIPVTHRKVSSSVAFITGNEDPTKAETSIDWQGLAHGAQTLCFYMGVKNLPLITQRLMDAGRDPQEPVALVRWGTTPLQEVLDGTLENIAQRAAEANFQAPAIIVVGQVAALRDQIDWQEKLPLAGMTIAVTRARTQASVLVEKLRAQGAQVIECPTIQIEDVENTAPIRASIAKLAQGHYNWVVFTSVNGVEHFFRYLAEEGCDARSFYGAKVAAIGTATAAELANRGIIADIVPPEFRAESVAKTMLADGVNRFTSVLIARAAEARDVLPDSLKKAGAQVDVVPVYRTTASTKAPTRQALQRIVDGEVDGITFTATSTVRGLLSLLTDYLGDRDAAEKLLNQQNCFSIGPITSCTLRTHEANVAAEAQVYTIDGLIEAIVAYATQRNC